jgi:hypothetical protein
VTTAIQTGNVYLPPRTVRLGMVPRFDVFSGKFQGNSALWMDCTNDFRTAEEMMKKMAVESPGRYFIFSAAEREVLTVIDTTSNQRYINHT